MDDLGTLGAAANASSSSSGEVLWIMSPAKKAQCVALVPHLDNYILASSQLPTQVVAVDPLGLVHGFSGMEILASSESVVHMSDTPGLDISTATPSQSMFQTAAIALPSIVSIAFTKRHACVAWGDAVWT